MVHVFGPNKVPTPTVMQWLRGKKDWVKEKLGKGIPAVVSALRMLFAIDAGKRGAERERAWAKKLNVEPSKLRAVMKGVWEYLGFYDMWDKGVKGAKIAAKEEVMKARKEGRAPNLTAAKFKAILYGLKEMSPFKFGESELVRPSEEFLASLTPEKLRKLGIKFKFVSPEEAKPEPAWVKATTDKISIAVEAKEESGEEEEEPLWSKATKGEAVVAEKIEAKEESGEEEEKPLWSKATKGEGIVAEKRETKVKSGEEKEMPFGTEVTEVEGVVAEKRVVEDRADETEKKPPWNGQRCALNPEKPVEVFAISAEFRKVKQRISNKTFRIFKVLVQEKGATIIIRQGRDECIISGSAAVDILIEKKYLHRWKRVGLVANHQV